MNENLRRALLRARLTDEDVAARLEVDPKTVRRWLEGRLPHLRHRWALAGLLDLDEVELWPQSSSAPSVPVEVQAIYPHSKDVPPQLWHDLLSSAEHEIAILANSGVFLDAENQALATLKTRAKSGVQERICLPDPHWSGTSQATEVLSAYGIIHNIPNVQMRLYSVALSSVIYRADDQLLVSQIAFGIPAEQAPVLHLRHTDATSMVATYLESFERVWSDAIQLPTSQLLP